MLTWGAERKSVPAHLGMKKKTPTVCFAHQPMDLFNVNQTFEDYNVVFVPPSCVSAVCVCSRREEEACEASDGNAQPQA